HAWPLAERSKQGESVLVGAGRPGRIEGEVEWISSKEYLTIRTVKVEARVIIKYLITRCRSRVVSDRVRAATIRIDSIDGRSVRKCQHWPHIDVFRRGAYSDCC